MRKINITVDAMGGTKFDAEGFNGQGCLDATKVFEQALGGTPTNRNMKNEFYLPDNDTVTQRQRI